MTIIQHYKGMTRTHTTWVLDTSQPASVFENFVVILIVCNALVAGLSHG